MSGRINGEFAHVDWVPIRYVNQGYPRAGLAGLFRAADVGLVTPLRDGMNLVAKEFVAAQDPADPGVLILSQFAGAAEQMGDALLVNPYSRDEISDRIHDALNMPLAERRSRWEKLADGVRRQDVHWWRKSFLDALTGTHGPRPRRIARGRARGSPPLGRPSQPWPHPAVAPDGDGTGCRSSRSSTETPTKEEEMARSNTTTSRRSDSARSQSNGSERSAFSWGSTGSWLGAAAAGAAFAIAANLGRKLAMQGMSAAAGDWDDVLTAEHGTTLALFDKILATDDTQTVKRAMMIRKLTPRARQACP